MDKKDVFPIDHGRFSSPAMLGMLTRGYPGDPETNKSVRT